MYSENSGGKEERKVEKKIKMSSHKHKIQTPSASLSQFQRCFTALHASKRKIESVCVCVRARSGAAFGLTEVATRSSSNSTWTNKADLIIIGIITNPKIPESLNWLHTLDDAHSFRRIKPFYRTVDGHRK